MFFVCFLCYAVVCAACALCLCCGSEFSLANFVWMRMFIVVLYRWWSKTLGNLSAKKGETHTTSLAHRRCQFNCNILDVYWALVAAAFSETKHTKDRIQHVWRVYTIRIKMYTWTGKVAEKGLCFRCRSSSAYTFALKEEEIKCVLCVCVCLVVVNIYVWCRIHSNALPQMRPAGLNIKRLSHSHVIVAKVK